MRTRINLIAMLLGLVVSTCVSAMTIKDLSPGNTTSGPKFSLKEMEGKVVYVEYWGVRCPACMQALPIVAKVYDKYQDQGFHVIGLECQMSTKDQIDEVVASKGMKFQVTSSGNLRGSNVTGIPHGFLFGADGNLISEVHAGELEKAVQTALKDVAGAMAGPGPYKLLAPQAAQIKTGQGIGMTLKAVRTKLASTKADETAEAKLMVDALTDNFNNRYEFAMEQKTTEPLGAVDKLDKLALQFAGDELGAKAKKESDGLKADPKFRKELEAAGMYKQLETMVDQLKPFLGEKNFKAEGFRKMNMNSIMGIVSGCQTLNQRYPGTIAADKATELMKKFQ